MTEKEKKHRFKIAWLRHAVQVMVFVVFLLPLLATGWSLFGMSEKGDSFLSTPSDIFFFGSLSSSDIFGLDLLDPLALFEIIAASKFFDITWLLLALPVLIGYGIIRGRAFCGFVCPVNLLCEIIDFIRRKLGFDPSPLSLSRHGKIIGALVVIVLSALLSFPLFEMLSPIGAINKGILFGALAGVITLGAIIVVEVVSGSRVWCRSLCPLGGVYEVLGVVGQLNVACDHGACIECNKCKEVCLADPLILDPVISGKRGIVAAGDCMACGNCIDVCPTHALRFKVGRCEKTLCDPHKDAIQATGFPGNDGSEQEEVKNKV